MKHKIYSFVIAFSIFFGANAQESFSTIGSNYSNASGSISATAGQLSVFGYSDIEGTVSPGVQQPYEITVIDGISEFEDFTCTIYPNPTNDFIQLTVGSTIVENTLYVLYDMKGEFLESREVTKPSILINMGHYPVGAYFLLITNNHREVKAFNIIKN